MKKEYITPTASLHSTILGTLLDSHSKYDTDSAYNDIPIPDRNVSGKTGMGDGLDASARDRYAIDWDF